MFARLKTNSCGKPQSTKSKKTPDDPLLWIFYYFCLQSLKLLQSGMDILNSIPMNSRLFTCLASLEHQTLGKKCVICFTIVGLCKANHLDCQWVSVRPRNVLFTLFFTRTMRVCFFSCKIPNALNKKAKKQKQKQKKH